MVHDTGRGGENNVTELTRWEKLDDPLLEICEADVVSGGDDTSLVEAEEEISQSIKDKGEVLSYRPFNWMTILPDRWSSTSSNSPMYPDRKCQYVAKD